MTSTNSISYVRIHYKVYKCIECQITLRSGNWLLSVHNPVENQHCWFTCLTNWCLLWGLSFKFSLNVKFRRSC